MITPYCIVTLSDSAVCFENAFQITYGVQSARCAVSREGGLLSVHGGNVVDADRHIDTFFYVIMQDVRHADIPVVMECFVKARRRTRNVAEMDKENFIRKQVGNIPQIFAHQVKICLAKRNAQRFARANIENSLFYIFFTACKRRNFLSVSTGTETPL